MLLITLSFYIFKWKPTTTCLSIKVRPAALLLEIEGWDDRVVTGKTLCLIRLASSPLASLLVFTVVATPLKSHPLT